MNRLIILIDSSTKASSKSSKYGESSAAWAVWWNNIDRVPIRAGSLYLWKEGPNKIFYDGLIRALEACFYLVHKGDEVTIYGDNQHVIQQLQGGKGVREMQPYFNQITKMSSKYPCKISFTYLGESNKAYKKVDELAKQFRNMVKLKYKYLGA